MSFEGSAVIQGNSYEKSKVFPVIKNSMNKLDFLTPHNLYSTVASSREG